MATRHGVTAHQVALAFITRHPDVFAIPKAGRLEHVRDNAAAGDLHLEASELAALEAKLPTTPPGSRLPIL